MTVTRRQFMKVSAAGLAASSMGALGFIEAGEALAAGVRPFRLEKATETRNACPYCAVACGVLIYSMADGTSKDAKPKVVHIEGDPDHPVNRGTLCPRGAASLGYVHSANRLQYPMHRKPGSDKFERVMTGRHMTMRCDGNTTPNVAFGRPIFYGQAAQGVNQTTPLFGNRKLGPSQLGDVVAVDEHHDTVETDEVLGGFR